jgi:5-enolpyruvylshikimate-3-phosphate synthase
MGVVADTAAGGRLPALIKGGRLTAIRYAPPEASAQVKSAIMLAGLRAESGDDDKLLTVAARVFDGLYRHYQQDPSHD